MSREQSLGRVKKVEHQGRIVSATPELYKVEIESKSACASCHAKGLCSASEMELKIIEVKRHPEDNYKVGERVLVELEERLGLRAALIVYAPPIVILVAILLYLQYIQVSEIVIGLSVILGIVLYFVVLYLLRGVIGRGFHFTIRKTMEDN